MNLGKGQSRVVIENVQPQVDGGFYPSKRTVGNALRLQPIFLVTVMIISARMPFIKRKVNHPGTK